jgi:hypothetical protein
VSNSFTLSWRALWGIFALLSLFYSHTLYAQQACPVIVLVTGDEALAAQVQALLIEDGLQVKPVDECPFLLAHIEKGEKGILLRLTDTEGRAGERLVTESKTVVAIIEAWALTDLSAQLLLLRQTPEAPTTAPDSLPTAPALPAVFLPVSLPSLPSESILPESLSLRVGVLTEAILAGESFGPGVLSEVCMQIQGLCIGASFRYYILQRSRCDSACFQIQLPQLKEGTLVEVDTKKRGGDLLMKVSLSKTKGSFSRGLSLSAGLGWIKIYSGITQVEVASSSHAGPRLDAAFEASWAFAPQLSLSSSVGFGVAPLANIDSVILEPVFLDGEPTSFLRVGLGLQFGGL